MATIEDRIASCDPSLFSHIESWTTGADQRSLLALQAACREQVPEFVYLEVGSHLGGSLQPFVVDPRCRKIISIDPRPQTSPDERGYDSNYVGNSTERMMRNLANIPGADLTKVHTIEASTSRLSPSDIPDAPNLCFIDAEHTDDAALRDGRFCLSVVADKGCIAFHDAQILYRALTVLVSELRERGIEFQAYVLPSAIFAIELGESRIGDNEHVRAALADNYDAFLWALRWNDQHWAEVKDRLDEQEARRRAKRKERGLEEPA